MALFVQIDHFRKTDQKPTVKNHLFSISWFRSFNRTSFQQQLKPDGHCLVLIEGLRFNRTSFQQQLKPLPAARVLSILSGFNRTSFQQQLKLLYLLYPRVDLSFNRTSFQQQLKLWFSYS